MNKHLMSFMVMTTLLSGSAVFATTDQAVNVLEQGKALYENHGRGGCVQCHGLAGNAPVIPLYPKIGGQSELYLYNQMIDYREKRRQNGLYVPMEVAMQPFTDAEIKAIAVYLSEQKMF